MMVNSTVQFLAKIMAIALLAAVSKTWAFGYLVGDTGLFLIYKLVRHDFIHYLPEQGYVGTIAISLASKIIDKVREDM